MARWYLVAALVAALVPGHGLVAAVLRTVLRHVIGGAL
jgi:uncharacterized membrane protein YjjP (DUF1212 family)